MSFYAAIIASMFGRGSNKPLRAATFRLLGFCVVATGIGAIVSHGFGAMPILAKSPFWQVACLASFATEIVVALGLLSASGVIYAHGSLRRQLLQTWPLTKSRRLISDLLPGLVIVCLALVLVMPLLGKLFIAMGLSPFLLGVCVLAGVGSGFGLVFAFSARFRLLSVVFIPGVLWAQYQLLTHVQNISLTPTYRQSMALTFWLVSILLVVLLPYRADTSNIQETSGAIRHPVAGVPYFIKKMLRAKSTRLGLVVTLLIRLGLGYALHRQAVFDFQLPLTIAAIMLASLISDLRSLASRYNPAEITALWGSQRFTFGIITAAFAASVSIMPLVWLACQGSNHLAILLAISQLLFACGVGLFAGNLIVPEQHDVSSQCLTALICIGVFSWPLYTPLAAWPLAHQASLYLGASLLFISAACLVEYKRNTYIWRKYESKK